jgi:hypothetical protein
LISHSIGGLYALVFIACYPALVHSAIFLDSTQKTDLYLEKLHSYLVDSVEPIDQKIYMNWIDNFNQIPDPHTIPARIVVISVIVLKTSIDLESMIRQASKLKFNRQLTNRNSRSYIVTYVDDNHMIYMAHPQQIISLIKLHLKLEQEKE